MLARGAQAVMHHLQRPSSMLRLSDTHVLAGLVRGARCRLLERGRKYQEKLQQVQRMQDEQPRDAATGQPLFRPKTHRPPQYSRNPDGESVGSLPAPLPACPPACLCLAGLSRLC